MIKAILFDWGDTLMRVFPQFHGAMKDWPKVTAIPGIQDACEDLVKNYRLYIATNASESGPNAVYEALSRVELNKYFSGIFTAHDLGCTKLSASFYDQILADLSYSPEEVLMMGDDHQVDVTVPAKLGIRSIWFIPDGSKHTRFIPIQSGEVHSMEELPEIIQDLMDHPIPTMNECFSLLSTHTNDENILKHVSKVALAAYLIGELCRDNGHSVNPILAHRGGLLHDLDKLISLRSDLEHGQEGNRILRANGYSSLGRIAQSHPAFSLLDPQKASSTLEEKIVYLADKLIDGDKIVGLKARLVNLTNRYPEDNAKFELTEPLMVDLQDEILSHLKLSEPKLIEFLTRSISLMV